MVTESDIVMLIVTTCWRTGGLNEHSEDQGVDCRVLCISGRIIGSVDRVLCISGLCISGSVDCVSVNYRW